MNKFSLVMPAYNSSLTIAESLDSLLDQDFANWECIIINDGSVDNTEQIVSQYCKNDSRFKLYSQPNSGTAAANNKGISLATGDFVSVFPSDDLLAPNYLSTMDRMITDHPNHEVYLINGYLLFEDGSKELMNLDWLANGEISTIDIIKSCPCSLGAMSKSGLHARVGFYRSERYTEDYDFWIRASLKGATFYFEDIPLVYARISDTQKSADKSKIWNSDLLIMDDVLAELSLSPETHALAVMRREQIATWLSNLSEGAQKVQRNRILDLELKESSERFQLRLESCLGVRGAAFVRPLVFKFTGIVRPVRERLAARRLQKKDHHKYI